MSPSIHSLESPVHLGQLSPECLSLARKKKILIY